MFILIVLIQIPLQNIPFKHDNIVEKCDKLRANYNIFLNGTLILDRFKLNNKHFSEFNKHINLMKNNYKKNAQSLLTIVKAIVKKEEISIKYPIEEESINLNNTNSSTKLDIHVLPKNDKHKSFKYSLIPITEKQLDDYIIKAAEDISNLLKGCHTDYKVAVHKLILGYELFIEELNKDAKQQNLIFYTCVFILLYYFY